MRDVSGKTFVLQVFDKDTLSKDDPLGEVKDGISDIPILMPIVRFTFPWPTLTRPRGSQPGCI